MAACAFGIRLQRVVAAAEAAPVGRVERGAAVGELVDVVSEHAMAGGFACFAALASALVDVLAAAAGAMHDDRAPGQMARILVMWIGPLRRGASRSQIRDGDSRADLC
jgi:hypothetical protein